MPSPRELCFTTASIITRKSDLSDVDLSDFELTYVDPICPMRTSVRLLLGSLYNKGVPSRMKVYKKYTSHKLLTNNLKRNCKSLRGCNIKSSLCDTRTTKPMKYSIQLHFMFSTPVCK